MSFEIDNFLSKVEGEARPRAVRAGVTAVDKFANHVVGKAQQLAPVETGVLKSSGTAEPARMGGRDAKGKFVGGKTITARIGFNTDYAAAVHERLDQHHDEGQAKYLEAAMRQEESKLVPFTEKEMRDAL